MRGLRSAAPHLEREPGAGDVEHIDGHLVAQVLLLALELGELRLEARQLLGALVRALLTPRRRLLTAKEECRGF